MAYCRRHNCVQKQTIPVTIYESTRYATVTCCALCKVSSVNVVLVRFNKAKWKRLYKPLNDVVRATHSDAETIQDHTVKVRVIYAADIHTNRASLTAPTRANPYFYEYKMQMEKYHNFGYRFLIILKNLFIFISVCNTNNTIMQIPLMLERICLHKDIAVLVNGPKFNFFNKFFQILGSASCINLLVFS